LVAGLPDRVYAAAAKNTLVLGLDISDSITFDPAREAQYTPPLTLTAAYEALITMTPGDYLDVKPALASSWARTPDGKGWRFTLRPGTKFNSGNPVTADDVKWSIERVMFVKDQPSQYVVNVDHVAVAGGGGVELLEGFGFDQFGFRRREVGGDELGPVSDGAVDDAGGADGDGVVGAGAGLDGGAVGFVAAGLVVLRARAGRERPAPADHIFGGRGATDDAAAARRSYWETLQRTGQNCSADGIEGARRETGQKKTLA
jgi:hypothetical protein